MLAHGLCIRHLVVPSFSAHVESAPFSYSFVFSSDVWSDGDAEFVRTIVLHEFLRLLRLLSNASVPCIVSHSTRVSPARCCALAFSLAERRSVPISDEFFCAPANRRHSGLDFLSYTINS